MASQRDEMNPGVTLENFRPQGGWMDPPADLQPALEGKVTADVVIVGAGFAGLSTALELAAKGADVVVLERDYAGFGASGRNAGYLAGSMGVEFEFFLKRVGLKRAKEIVRFYDEGVDYVERRLGELGIDCDYNASGIIRAAVHPSQEKRLRKGMELGLQLGSKTEFLDPAAMRARGVPPAFLFGCYQRHGGTLDPGKYVLGLRRAALQAGVRIYEKTPLISYREGPVVTCMTEKGSASAPFLVLATNAYTPQLGLLGNKVVPLRVSAIETDRLSPSQLESLGWQGREGIVTPHWTMESHRLTARNSLVVTTKRLGYTYGGKTPNVPDQAAYGELAVALSDRFPTLRGIGIKSCWSGYVSLAYDALPVVGETGGQNNVFHTAGCSGHGVATQSLMGQLLAERINGVEHPLLAALRHKTPTTLPEPLQWCAFKLALGAANRMDDYINRNARKAKS
ncbi:NAD(P)/FAD-dependent oxidoreductase [Marinobacter sp. SS21]|uniref:NAD(P)/FAD-dependent oxidoreductase n=1 Tax=Marinobacter sp. SS21 TaxID=2979460 RepID=UPI00232F0834|nr:FAD-dependent oxidoreductase [Marinobacter sp. SS21]MDC0662677.1 FAD-dependent oxidoreductase [Marinobacter sp. SS21]